MEFICDRAGHNYSDFPHNSERIRFGVISVFINFETTLAMNSSSPFFKTNISDYLI